MRPSVGYGTAKPACCHLDRESITIGLTGAPGARIIAAVKRGARTTLWILLGFGFVVASAYNLTGLYVMPPKDAPPDGVTLVYNRRATGLPFLASPDGQLERQRGAVNPDFVPIGPREHRIIARLPFNQALYLRTTGNVEFLK